MTATRNFHLQQNKNRGLDALLKGNNGGRGTRSGQRSVANRSFHNQIGSHINTENNPLDMSTILGSATSVQPPVGDEDIVMDSGGR